MSRQDPKKHADLDGTFNADKDLNEVWPEVIAEFERVTEKKLDPGTTFESFQLTVNERLRDATSKRSSHARKILNNVGQCLQQFGSIIAGGAGMVFGPSAQCWNAISFVITAAQKYSEVLDGFVTLMERCAAFLSRLNLFLKQECGKHGEYLPSHVRKPAYAILSHFIDILRHSYKLSKSKREKFKLVLEIVLFSGDAGVQSSLDLLERHVQDFTNTQIDQILVDVKGLARYLQESDETRQRHQAEIREHLESIYEVSKETLAVTQQVKITLDGHITQEKNREDLEKIRKAFGLKSGEEPWTKRHDHICKARAKDSCRWLIEREDLGFLAWADIQNRQKNTKILTVEGDPGYGKTFISNKVVSCLHDMYRNNNSADRVSIAYYYYGEDREDSLEKCIRCIIYQFASTEPAYARAVAEACQAPGSIATAEDIWERLLVKVQHTMKGTYYICIDGYACSEVASNGDAIGKIAQSVLSSIKGISIRLYFSGTNEAVARVPQENHAIRTIVLGPAKDLGNRMVRLGSSPSEESTALIPLVNASDLEAFALARVDELGEKKPDLKTVMTEMNIKKLVAGVYGNYEHLEAKIVQINACDTEQKIQDVIDSTGDDLMTTVRSSLRVSSEALNSEQIRLLNEILVWVVGHGYPDIDFLQSALYLAFRKTFMVRDMIATTFSGFLAIDENDRIKLKSDQILQILREQSQSHVKLSRPGSATTELSQAEIDLCSHIVKNVCGDYVYGRFNFDGFFNSLAGKQNAAVELADENALNVTITRSLLQALCEPKDEKHLKTIRLHASIWFYEHIKTFINAIDYFEPDREMLTEIGSKLSQVLYETESIDNWFSTEYSETLKADLVVGDNFLEPMQKILRNPHAAKGYSQDAEKKKWIESVIGAEATKYAILGKVASTLGNVWFTCKTMTDPRHLWIPYGIFSKETTGKFDPDNMPELTQVADYLQWIQKFIGLGTDNPIWSFRVGATYSAFEHYDEALRIFKEVEAQLQDNWCLLLAIAETYVGRKEFPAALLYLHKLKDLYDKLVDTDSEFKKMYWERVVLPEGDCHRQVKDYDSAIHSYREILLKEIDSESYPGAVHAKTLAALFGLWNEIDQHGSLLAFLRELRAGEEPTKSLKYWLGTVVSKDDQLHYHILKAAKKCETIEEVCQMYDEAMQSKSTEEAGNGQESETTPEMARELRYFRTALKFHGSSLQSDHDEALETWEDMIANPGKGWNAYWISYKVSRVLSPALLDKASIDLSISAQSKYAAKLEALCRSNQQAVREVRQSPHDPQFCLIRLCILQSNNQLADEEARRLLRGVFDGWPKELDDDSLRTRYATLAQILTVFDLDNDAVAAWQILKPRGTKETTTEDEAESNPAPTGETTSSTTQSTAEAERAKSPTPTFEAHLNYYSCDAECGTLWRNMLTDCWACKNCLCVQLCSPCYEKLQRDELSPLVCRKEHKFVYLPKFDEQVWSSVPDDSILVGGKLMTRDQWLNQFRERWDVQQEQIDAYKLETARKLKATVCIANYVLKWKRKRTNKLRKIHRARTFPLLQNH